MMPQTVPRKQRLSNASLMLAKVIQQQRTALGLSQDQLAKRAALHVTYIDDLERGTRNISFETLLRVAKSLEIPTWMLVRLAEQAENAKNEITN